MRLVHDADNAVHISDLPAELRQMADEIEAGEFGDVRTALILLDTPDRLFMEERGGSRSRYEVAGMLSLASQIVFDD